LYIQNCEPDSKAHKITHQLPLKLTLKAHEKFSEINGDDSMRKRSLTLENNGVWQSVATAISQNNES